MKDLGKRMKQRMPKEKTAAEKYLDLIEEDDDLEMDEEGVDIPTNIYGAMPRVRPEQIAK